MDRNRLQGAEGDRIIAILCTAAMNLLKLHKHPAVLLRLFLNWIMPGADRRPLFSAP